MQKSRVDGPSCTSSMANPLSFPWIVCVLEEVVIFDKNLIMQSHSHMSSSTQLFLVKLKEFLESIGVSFSEFFSNFETINKSALGKLQFFRIVSLLHIETHSNFDPQQVFSELARRQETIELAYLKRLHSALGTLMSERKVSEEKSRQDEMQKKMIRIGIYKLQEFMKRHESPLAFLREFDRDGNGGLSKNEFNSLLLATDIRELSSKDIRRIVIEHIYKYFQPRREISMKELADFFKINTNQHPRTPIFPQHPHSPSPNVPRPQEVRPSPNKYPEVKPEVNNPFGKKNQKPKFEIHQKPKFQSETQETSDMDNHISNCEASYPKAMRFYRQGDPAPSEHAYMQEMQELLVQGKKYVDGSNPAITEGSYVSAAEIFKTEKYHMFQMASSVLVREVSRIGIARQIEPKDIIQGSVGDCYFLSSIASIISIYPELIAERFLFNKNPANYYAVKLFIDGQWRVIKTDDRFPCRGSTPTPLYAKPHTQEIWVMLLEKCWAKNFGSYRAIESGSSKQGFMALTGAPSEIINHDKDKNETDSIKQLEIAHGHKYVATVSGSQYLESLGKAGEEKLGLVSGHAYSLLRTIKVGNETLVKLRNPWGKTTWKGLWSFESSQWTKELRDRYNYTRNPQDGSFYMSWKDFGIYFGEIVVCKLNPTFLHSCIQVKTDRRKSAYVLLRIKTAGQYIISLYQQNKRKFINKYTNYEYSQARLIVLRRDGKTLRYVGAKSTQQSQACSVDLQRLEEGEYLISSKVWWKFWDNHEMIITVYGTDYANLSPVNRAIAPDFKAGLVRSYAAQFAGTGKIKSYEKYGFNATCETNFNIDSGIGFVRMANNSEKSFESVQDMNIKGLKVIKPDRLPLTFKMAPRSQRVVGFFVKPSGYEYSSTEKITY